VWIEMSTVSPGLSRDLAGLVRSRRAEMLDAPLSGSVPQIHQGTLTIMVGGDADAYGRVEPLLRVLGSATHVGDNGQGLALKLAINISLAVQMLAFSEGLVLAERAGLAPALAGRVMTQSAIGSPMLKARLPLVLERPGEAWFEIGLMQKDIRLALEAGDALGVPLPSTRAAEEVLDDARERGYAHRDIAALVEFLDEPSEAMAR
jgi:3-hydroxyisobutyrate dehydrogenase-like beta-hydroxyacid dehydrogenase